MKFSVALKLGRVSNLPTVASNVVAATALAGADASAVTTMVVIAATSLAYVAGMFLNDAFDREIDARERSDRPIPAGEASTAEVFAWGGAMLVASVLLVGLAAWTREGPLVQPVVSGLALAALIVLYDAWHKGNAIAPVLMGLCRSAVIATTACVLGVRSWSAVVIGAVVLLAYVAGLTYSAKQEHLGRLERAWPLGLLFAPFVGYVGALREITLATAVYVGALAWVIATVRPLLAARRAPGDVPKAVVRLIAGIALIDALAAASAGRIALASLAGAAFPATLALQRRVRGT